MNEKKAKPEQEERFDANMASHYHRWNVAEVEKSGKKKSQLATHSEPTYCVSRGLLIVKSKTSLTSSHRTS
jgi:hypothetical protein